jgi:hypothetical protein
MANVKSHTQIHTEIHTHINRKEYKKTILGYTYTYYCKRIFSVLHKELSNK